METPRANLDAPERMSTHDWDLWFRTRQAVRRELMQRLVEQRRRTLIGRLRYWLTGSYF